VGAGLSTRQVGSQAKISQNVDQMQISRDDFEHALEEVKPAFGVAQEELEAVLENGIIDYDDTSAHLLQTGALYVQQVRQSDRTPLVSVLLRGAILRTFKILPDADAQASLALARLPWPHASPHPPTFPTSSSSPQKRWSAIPRGKRLRTSGKSLPIATRVS
jgi:hypothetical protein